MNENAQKGKTFVALTAGWLIGKEILNYLIAVIGNGSIFGVIGVVIAIGLSVALFICPHQIR